MPIRAVPAHKQRSPSRRKKDSGLDYALYTLLKHRYQKKESNGN